AALALALLTTACNGGSGTAGDTRAPAAPEPMQTTVEMDSANPFVATAIAAFDQPWAMSFLPDGRLLVSEKPGTLKLVDPATGQTGEISGVPAVVDAGQGGFGDVMPHPQHADNGLVYISYAEAGDGDTAGAAVARARLVL